MGRMLVFRFSCDRKLLSLLFEMSDTIDSSGAQLYLAWTDQESIKGGRPTNCVTCFDGLQCNNQQYHIESNKWIAFQARSTLKDSPDQISSVFL
jgi:hypothetical protein